MRRACWRRSCDIGVREREQIDIGQTITRCTASENNRFEVLAIDQPDRKRTHTERDYHYSQQHHKDMMVVDEKGYQPCQLSISTLPDSKPDCFLTHPASSKTSGHHSLGRLRHCNKRGKDRDRRYSRMNFRVVHRRSTRLNSVACGTSSQSTGACIAPMHAGRRPLKKEVRNTHLERYTNP